MVASGGLRGRPSLLRAGEGSRRQHVLSGGRNDEETIYCSHDDRVGPIVGSYAVLMSDSMVAVGRVKANRGTTIVWTRKH